MKLDDILSEEQLDEFNVGKAIGKGVNAGAGIFFQMGSHPAGRPSVNEDFQDTPGTTVDENDVEKIFGALAAPAQKTKQPKQAKQQQPAQGGAQQPGKSAQQPNQPAQNKATDTVFSRVKQSIDKLDIQGKKQVLEILLSINKSKPVANRKVNQNMKIKEFESILEMFEGIELGNDSADTPAWYIIGLDGHIASGPYGSESEASSDTRRLQWYNTSKYDIAYGLQNDDDMFVDAETGTVGEGVGSAPVDGTPNVTGHRIPQKGDTIRTKNGVTGKVYAQKGQSVYFTVADGPSQSCLLNACKVVQELEDDDVYEAENDNFTADDIKRLEQISDLPTLKAQAKELVKGKAARRMKPEKIAFFYDKIDSMTKPMVIIKLMYDLLLSGEGNSVVGSRNSMKQNSYRSRFGEGGMGGINRAAPAQDVSYEKVLDEVTSKYRVDELSVDKMRAYKDAAQGQVKNRPLRKIARTVAAVNKADDKIRTKTGDRRRGGSNVVMGNLEERLAHFVNEVCMEPDKGEMEEAMAPGTSPWGGTPKKLARRPSMKGSPTIPFSELVQDTIKTHGLKWAFDFYVKKHGLPTREFRIFAGI